MKTENPECCIVKLYEAYLSVRPTDPRCPNDFYLRPLTALCNNVRYSCQPMGGGKLSKVIASMASAAKLDGSYELYLEGYHRIHVVSVKLR